MAPRPPFAVERVGPTRIGYPELKPHDLRHGVAMEVYGEHHDLEQVRALLGHQVSIRKEGDDYVAQVFGAIAIANTIAYVSEILDPVSIFIGLTRRNLMSQAVRYLLFGEGETGLMVYTILLRYWDWTPEADVRPLIFLMSD